MKKIKNQISEMSSQWEKEIFGFLKDIIRIKSTSTNEKDVIKRIKKEMETLEFDEIIIDRMGNILGRVGNGKRIIAYDGHIDTVDVGSIDNWDFDPFAGIEDDTYIYGRGASDQKGGFTSILFGAAIAKKLDLLDGITLWVTGTVQEEDCDGLCWQHILEEKTIEPEFVVLSEPTGINVYRGQRGRMEIRVEVSGISSHGSAPERGDNAIYKMAPIITELNKLNEHLKFEDFLGKGTLTISEIFFTSPSRCAVADGCSISIDRRLTAGETMESAIAEIRALPSVAIMDAKVEMYRYEVKSYTGLEQSVDCYFPTWTLPEDSIFCQTLVEACKQTLGQKPFVDKWTFSTNGVSIMGMKGIPCVGFGPGMEKEAHAPNEKILKDEVIKAVNVYALIPTIYGGITK
ncbi:MAG: M20/DapE family protein YgeY [Clostridiales bacterium 38_11]|nr:MAG: M20/DapE family protein YgeY [Clostridiales bacterium 38_11]HBH11560.1 YgeY family selenium metabolism-linked hydrolase [Clostridiales bacterium]